MDRIRAALTGASDPQVSSETSELLHDLDPVLGSTRALGPLIDPNECHRH